MSTKMLLFWLSTTVIFLALVFVSGTYFYLYFRDKKWFGLLHHQSKEQLWAIIAFEGEILRLWNTR